jgi:SRSO17 transposase
MDIQASPTTLPQLEEFLSPFKVRFRRPEGEAALERSLTGRFTELPKKTCDTMAEAVPGTSEQCLQEFLTNRPWDEQDLNRQRVEKLIAEATLGNGVRMFDATGFAKQGQASVGVARQSSGTLGKVGNCQVAGTCCDDAPHARWPVAGRWSLPETWTEAPERLQRARGPADVTFQTTPPMALALLDQARQWGVPQRGVVTDADSGDTPQFLSGLEARHERSVVAIRGDCQGRPQCRGAPPSPRADQGLAAVARRQWRTSRWRHGTTGGWRKQCVALRAWRLTAEGEAHSGWWLGERAARGHPEEPNCSWSNLPASATVEELVDSAHRRHAMEQCHEEAKEEWGGEQYQGRWWPGFHRQAVTGMRAWSFLRWLELRQRHHHPKRGRPRAPFSPSAGSLASRPARGASGGGAMAAPPSRVVVDHHGSVHGTVLT